MTIAAGLFAFAGLSLLSTAVIAWFGFRANTNMLLDQLDDALAERDAANAACSHAYGQLAAATNHPSARHLHAVRNFR